MRDHETIAAALFNRGASVRVRSCEGTGMVGWDDRGRVREFAAPAHARDAHSRIIHAHELMHSRFSSGAKCGTMAHQIAEDCLIHVAAALSDTYGNGGAVPHLWRDALAVGLTEARSGFNVVRSGASGALRTHARATALRAAYLPFIAMARRHEGCKRLTRTSDRMRLIASRVLCADRPPALYSEFESALWCAASRVLATVRKRRISKPLRESLAADRERLYALATALIEDPKVAPPPEDPRPMAPEEGEGVHYMEPPLTAPCSPPLSGMRRVPMASGARIRTHRLAAVATGAESRPFAARIRRPDVSAVVLDLSGSMRWDDASLARLCAALPRTNVYGYCDHSPRGKRVDGTILRLAASGKRVGSIPRLSNGNGCDLQAVELALRHRGRVVFVSDLGFGGQSPERTDKALALLRANPRVQVVPSRDAALALFKA